jgi:hypothetical protein
MADDGPILDQNSREFFNKRLGALRNERQTFIPHWQECAQFIRPRKGRWLVQDRNKGDRRYTSIINSKATQAHGIARSGLLAGVMSPARPWFALSTPDPDLNEVEEVKAWLYRVATQMREIFNASNLYDMGANLLGELLLFGTGAMSHHDDFDNVARFYTHTAGSYFIDQNEKYEVDVLVREFEMTCRQIVTEFGLTNISQSVKNAWDRSDYEVWFPVVNFTEPNPDHKPGNPFLKAFRSVTYEPGNSAADKQKFLSQKGYHEFPAYVPRWDVTGEDIYATDCPAMTALGDIKGLQIQEKRKAQGIDKMVAPPLAGPASLRNVPISSLPNGATLYDGDQSAKGGLRALYQVQLNLSELRQDMKEVEGRIDSAFFVELFKPISNMPGIQPKNQFELSQRTQEAMLLVGPVLEHLHGDYLSPLIDRTFNQMMRARILPPPPPDLAGKPLKVEYISPLAMAQKQTALGGIDRLAAFIGGLLGYGLSGAADKFDVDNAIDEYGQALGVAPRILVADEVVAQKRAAAAQQQRQAQQAAMAGSIANTAKDSTSAVANLTSAGSLAGAFSGPHGQ